MKKKIIALFMAICFLGSVGMTTGCVAYPRHAGHRKEAPSHKPAPKKPGHGHKGGRR